MSVKFKKLAIVILFWGVFARSSNDESQNDDKENKKEICYYPGSNVNTELDIVSFPVEVNTTVNYNCTNGISSSDMQMFPVGGHSRQCLINGSWSGKSPICVHSLTKGFNNTVTFHENYSRNCTLSSLNKYEFQNEVFLSIYLYGPAWVDALEIEASEKLEVEVKGQPDHPEVNSTYDKREGNHHTRIWYSTPLKVDSIMEVTVKNTNSFTIKEFNILSQTGRSASWCPTLASMREPVTTDKVLPAGNICIQFPGGDTRFNFSEANDNCHKLNGTLIQPLNNRLQLLLENNNNYLTRFYWIGLKKADDSHSWKWASGENFSTSAFWDGTRETDTDDCVALSLSYEYKWINRNCSYKNKWICQTGYVACGYPDAKPFTSINITKDETSGFPKEVIYSCPPGFTLNGTNVRHCQNNGQWSDEAPFCERSIEDSISTEMTDIEDNGIEYDKNQSPVSTNRTGNDESWKNDSDSENKSHDVYTITAIGSVIAVVLVAAGALLIWKMKQKRNESDHDEGLEDVNTSFDSETLESTGELYEEISQERIISLNLHDSCENTYGYESIDENPSNSSTIGDVNMNTDDVNTQSGIIRSLPLPTLAEERNSHLEDQSNEGIEMNVIGKTGFIMVENDLYED